MRAWVLAVLIAVLASPVLPQCNYSPILSTPFRSSILDLAIDGNDLWAATAYGVAVYDRSVDPPRLSALVAVPGTTRVVRLGNGLAYAGSGNAIAVVRKTGRTLQLVRTVDAGSQVNDIIVTPIMLFAATNNGIFEFSLVDATNPGNPLQLSQKMTTSLALDGSTIYAADTDNSVEVFTLGPPLQHTGTIIAPANVTAVHVNNRKLFVSTALQTSVYIAGTSVGSVPFSILALAPLSGDVVFAGSNDRSLRAIDFSLPGTPVDLFRTDLAPSGGTINRVASLAIAGGRVYAGAGDIGIADFDVSSFSAPFAMQHIGFPGASSVLSLGDNFYLGLSHGVTEFKQSLTHLRSWDGSRADVVQDGGNGFLLTSSGASATLWALDSLGAVATATFRAQVAGAVLADKTVYAVLTDRTLWSADFSTTATPTPQQVVTGTLQPVSIARSGTAIAIADTRADGTTSVAMLGGSSVSVPGLATTAVALSNNIAAVQTFRGIVLIDLSSGSTAVLSNSSDAIARQLVMSGSRLLELTDSTLRVWDINRFALASEVTLPAQPVAVHIAAGSNVADVVTSAGVATIALDRLSHMPVAITAPNGNAFYKKIVASQNRIALTDARGIDVYTTAMDYAGSIRAAGIVDVAVSDSAIYTLSANMTVTAYTPFATQTATAAISEGSDAQALSITTVNGAVWVSIIRGCSSGACEKKTIVFDEKLSRTISMTGGIVDVAGSGSTAYAITDLPAELRAINIADATHPAIIASQPLTGTPASIAVANNIVYVLGAGLQSYTTGLTKIADLLASATSTPDQRIRIDGSCAIVTGRSASPQLFALPQFTIVNSPATPATPRGVATSAGAFYILTDNSIEIWSTAPPPPAPRRRPSR